MKKGYLCSGLLATLAVAALLTACQTGNAAVLLTKETGRQIQSLSGSQWSFRATTPSEWLPTAEWMPATVPGVVHTDLLALGKIDDPFASTNESKLQWIGEQTWEYKVDFIPTAALLEQSLQELVFNGLDTYAEVYLNDSLLLSADNMFLEWRIPVKGLLRAGEANHLRVVFLSVYEVGLKLAQAWPVKLPNDNDKGEWKTSVFTRKAPYQFGWDWGPRYLTAGVWRPVTLEGYAVAFDNIRYVQKSQSEKLAEFEAVVTLNTSPTVEWDVPITVMVTDEAGRVYGKSEVVPAGQSTVSVPFEIKNPKLWWPNGMGAPNLYTLNALVVAQDGKLLYDRNTQRIGVRTIRLVQESDKSPDGREAQSFLFEVNGQPCFVKGANYIPQDNFLPRVDSARYAATIDAAARSGMNMLRVWGGGIYEDELFYDLCDEQGVMVWQDFAFACSFYPWDTKFLDNVKREATYNVRRIRNHPSLAIWCGNNEIDEAWYHWGYTRVYKWTKEQQAEIKHGIDTLFRGVLADVVAAEDSGRYYHPSSPLYGRGNPKSQLMGDVHYWGVFHDEEPFSVYKDKPGRFSNEYGFQSLACYDTYREYFTPEDMQLYSEAMVIHQKNAKGYRVMEEYMVSDLPLLKDNFRTYVYLTQLLQAEGIKIAMEGHRSKRPWTMGSMYWQLNDCWPVASWSSMDSRYRWKALQYYAERSFAPTILSFERVDSSSMAVLWAMTDKLVEQKGEVSLWLMDFSGKVLWDSTMKVALAANSNLKLLSRPDAALLAGRSPQEVFLVAEGKLGEAPVRAVYYFTPLKELKLPVSSGNYTASYRKKDEHTVEATIRAHGLMKSVLFEAEALQDNPSDAYFDLLPSQERVITLHFTKPIPAGGVEALGIFVASLNDLVGRPSESPIKQNVAWPPAK